MDLPAIQAALRSEGLDGWLFADFRGSDALAYSILGLSTELMRTRRWYYYIPAAGEPTKLVHAIESNTLDSLPGSKRIFLPWSQLHEQLRAIVAGARRVAMQYSPNNAIPYVARVDAGTVELIRSFGVELISSADLISQFQATLTESQYQSHVQAADALGRIVLATFVEIRRRLDAGKAPDEVNIQRFILDSYAREGLISADAPIVAVDAHSADPHFSPELATVMPIRDGNFVLLDMWAKLPDPGSIYADITWVGFVGPTIPDEHQRIFAIARDARDAAVAAVQAAQSAGNSIRGCDVDDACRKVIVDAGLGEYFIHRTGHSIHETDHGNGANIDNLETRDERRLIPRTLFSVEPGIYLPGKFGVRTEIDVYLPDERSVVVTGNPPQTSIISI